MGEPGDATVVERRKRAGDDVPEPAGTRATEGGTHDSAPTSTSTRRYTYSTPAETLRAEEMLRTRAFLRVVLGLIVAIGGVLPVLGGDHVFKLHFNAGDRQLNATCGWGQLEGAWKITTIRIESTV